VETVGLIGIGRLGSAIAERLLAAGFDVVGYDLNAERRDWLELRGGRAASSYEVALLSRRVVLCVRSHECVRQMAPLFQPGTIVIDTTTAEPEESESTAAALRACGVAYLDAPCCDWHEQVRSQGGKFVCGGEASALAACRDILEAFASPLIYAGPPGAGSRMKRELENRA
jgi:3-hydroxyisobutyrate dehydrogenase-like beta-hydroxyacid dehydrogenase